MSENGDYDYTDDVTEDVDDLCPDLPQGWPYNCGNNMIIFWMGWQAWLAARGFTLNLRPTVNSFTGVGWCIPPFAASESESLPYAYRVREDDSEECLRDQDDLPLDISEWNMLVNCYNPYSPKSARHLLDGHRSPSDVHYCLFDFDISHIFPRDAPLSVCRRPSAESYEGALSYHPFDTSCGEYDYNPFAYDVACLGNLYKVHLSVSEKPISVETEDDTDPPL
ncbi:hypothetical protein TRAPUB_2352 [Trametes pubescens]|uniref:Uncharacterized protein n=1 Tax=Trametes pubescens TaxID=154538 RepID=A0A1M2VGS5_TRAPU|nr:hypothetical protein TRAPUB_2352 [Trametes pubescens]